MKPLIKILTGSTRPGRFNIQPAMWIHNIAKKHDDMKVELLDLADINLPFLDEAVPPSARKYSMDHTKKWSEMIDTADGFILVTPEYNHSYSAVLKNAIDFLFQEWNYKPVSFVSYGSVGGARAVEHLRGVAGEVKMYDIREGVMFPEPWNNKDEKGNYQFNENHEKTAAAMLDALSFWAKKMKEGREELQKTTK